MEFPHIFGKGIILQMMGADLLQAVVETGEREKRAHLVSVMGEIGAENQFSPGCQAAMDQGEKITVDQASLVVASGTGHGSRRLGGRLVLGLAAA